MRLYSCHFKFMLLLVGAMLTVAGTGYAQTSGTVLNRDASNQVYNPKNNGKTRIQDPPAARKPACLWVNKMDGTRIRVCGAAQRKQLLDQ